MLTKKEKQILELCKRGLKQKDIALRLRISQPAVSAFYTNAIRKIREAKSVLAFTKMLKLELEDE